MTIKNLLINEAGQSESNPDKLTETEIIYGIYEIADKIALHYQPLLEELEQNKLPTEEDVSKYDVTAVGIEYYNWQVCHYHARTYAELYIKEEDDGAAKLPTIMMSQLLRARGDGRFFDDGQRICITTNGYYLPALKTIPESEQGAVGPCSMGLTKRSGRIHITKNPADDSGIRVFFDDGLQIYESYLSSLTDEEVKGMLRLTHALLYDIQKALTGTPPSTQTQPL